MPICPHPLPVRRPLGGDNEVGPGVDRQADGLKYGEGRRPQGLFPGSGNVGGIAKRKDTLRQALEESANLGGRTIIEEYIKGREIQVAVLGDAAASCGTRLVGVMPGRVLISRK